MFNWFKKRTEESEHPLWTGEILVDLDTVSVSSSREDIHFEPIAWKDVHRIVVYSIDLFTIDKIVFELHVGENFFIVEEDMGGFEAFYNCLKQTSPYAASAYEELKYRAFCTEVFRFDLEHTSPSELGEAR